MGADMYLSSDAERRQWFKDDHKLKITFENAFESLKHAYKHYNYEEQQLTKEEMELIINKLEELIKQ